MSSFQQAKNYILGIINQIPKFILIPILVLGIVYALGVFTEKIGESQAANDCEEQTEIQLKENE